MLANTNMREITEAYFIQATGRKPENDDLERCNCTKAGQVGHMSCGWNYTHNAPCFEVGQDQGEPK